MSLSKDNSNLALTAIVVPEEVRCGHVMKQFAFIKYDHVQLPLSSTTPAVCVWYLGKLIVVTVT